MGGEAGGRGSQSGRDAGGTRGRKQGDKDARGGRSRRRILCECKREDGKKEAGNRLRFLLSCRKLFTRAPCGARVGSWPISNEAKVKRLVHELIPAPPSAFALLSANTRGSARAIGRNFNTNVQIYRSKDKHFQDVYKSSSYLERPRRDGRRPQTPLGRRAEADGGVRVVRRTSDATEGQRA